MKRVHDYHEFLIECLKDPEEAAGYLNVAMEDGDRKMFLIALKNVAEAHGGLVELSRLTKLNRANLYKIFSEKGNPEMQTLVQILDKFGLRLAITQKEQKSSAKKTTRDIKRKAA
ncbi:MAG: putative addiction module antidote protein [Elusimicrobia bacterium]|nr:putative addiction module antidote protein [Candidatus Obscuribacterium magneticum]